MNKNEKEFDKYARWGAIHRGCGGYLEGTRRNKAIKCKVCGTEISRDDYLKQVQVVVAGEHICCPRCGQWGKLQPLPENLPKDYSAIVLHDDGGAWRVCKVIRTGSCITPF